MTPAKMFDGDLWMLASDAVKMAENAYKKGQTDEREACAKVCEGIPSTYHENDPRKCADAIRARTKGETNT
jgi:hypothetical protein